jgi:predicted nucleic acid-binding protein
VRVFFDTSVLVAAMAATHPAHARALPRLQLVKVGADTGVVVAAHSLAELYAILTRLPLQPRISPTVAQQLIEQNVLAACEVVALSEAEYAALVAHLAATGIAGGATYDALILHTAAKAGVDRVLTLNVKDFRRVYPTLAGQIVEP